MSEFSHWLFGLVSSAERAHADAVAAAAGYGPRTFGLPTSRDGDEPATFWVFCTSARPGEILRIRAAMPPGVTLDDAPKEQWREPGSYFRARLAAHRLALILPEL